MSNEEKRYLVVTECKGIGYVVGFFEELIEAEKVIDALHNFNDSFFTLKVNQLYEQAMDYPTYKVHISCTFPIENCPRGITDGIYYSHVFDTTLIQSFTLKQFLFERANTIYAYNMDDYAGTKAGFVDFDLEFIAN